ncbi:MAG: DEAD/DEAH box helicase [Hyphomicrobiaceae bacterium]
MIGQNERLDLLTLFNELGLSATLLGNLEAEGYDRPTPVQAQSIPGILAGKDLLGIAQTGTGKTAAFALPILQRLTESNTPAVRNACRALVLAPTRELAAQIGESFRTYGRNLTLRTAVIFGGVSHRPQIAQMSRGVDILVATPGRLIDHMMERNITLAQTSVFVLDEADQMLDLGFMPAIRRIVKALPRQRQNLFFSATMPHDIAALASDLLHDPVRVSVAPVGTTAEKVDQRVIHIDRRRKSALLAELLADTDMQRTLVFTRTKRGADRLCRYLETVGIGSSAIHGNKSQRQREVALEDLRSGDSRVLVATDIAARGIDIDGVTHVINYELPEVPDAYVHRIGRTARAGADGKAIAFCDPEEKGLLRAIERLIRMSIPAEDRRGDTSLEVQVSPPRQHGRQHHQRGGPERHAGRGRAPGSGRDEESANDRRRKPGRPSHEQRRGSPRRDADHAAHGAPRAREDRPHDAPAESRQRPGRPPRDSRRPRHAEGAPGETRHHEHRNKESRRKKTGEKIAIRGPEPVAQPGSDTPREQSATHRPHRGKRPFAKGGDGQNRFRRHRDKQPHADGHRPRKHRGQATSQ